MIRRKTTVPAIALAVVGLSGAITGCAIYGPSGGSPPVPQRTAAEYLTASHYRAVVIVEGVGPNRPSYTFTSRPVISELATVLNSLSADTRTGVYNCPAGVTNYTLTFEPMIPHVPQVVASWFDCGDDDVTVNKVSQPALSDPTSELASIAGQLTHAGPLNGEPDIFNSGDLQPHCVTDLSVSSRGSHLL